MPELSMLDLLIAIAAHDFDTPMRGAARLLREADAMGLVVTRPPLTSSRTDRSCMERKFPVSLTNAGRSYVEAHEDPKA